MKKSGGQRIRESGTSDTFIKMALRASLRRCFFYALKESDWMDIGEGKLRMLIDEHPNEDFYVMNGNRALIKREKFEKYLDQATAV